MLFISLGIFEKPRILSEDLYVAHLQQNHRYMRDVVQSRTRLWTASDHRLDVCRDDNGGHIKV